MSFLPAVLAWGAAAAWAGIPRYPGAPTPHASLLFPVVHDRFVELHYVPVLRVGQGGVFLTARQTIRKMPARPRTLTLVNPLDVAQQDAVIAGTDPRSGLVLVRAPFEGPVYPLGIRSPRRGERVVLLGSPPRKMSHMVPIEHRVPDLRPLRAVGRIAAEGRLAVLEGPPEYAVSAGWAVLDWEGKTLVGLITVTDGKSGRFAGPDRIRKFLAAAGVPMP